MACGLNVSHCLFLEINFNLNTVALIYLCTYGCLCTKCRVKLVMTGAEWPISPKTFTIWPFREKAC